MRVIKSSGIRRAIGVIVPFAAIPAVVIAGAFVFREKSYSVAALAIVLLSLLLFISGFEKKTTGSRRLIITSIMTALAVAGRFIFSPIPGCNPITAIAVIAGIYLGSEAGFLVGSMSALISNFFAGQGVWTPFQMFAWGMVGLFAGFLSSYLRKNRAALYIYGTFSGIAYSLLMDVWTVLWYNNGFNVKLYFAALGTALPYTAIYAVSNIIFLLLLAKPMGEKLERIKIKYGI